MGEKKGGVFNIITVVIISALIIAALVIFIPIIMKQVTDGMTDLTTKGFDAAGDVEFNPGGIGGQ